MGELVGGWMVGWLGGLVDWAEWGGVGWLDGWLGGWLGGQVAWWSKTGKVLIL